MRVAAICAYPDGLNAGMLSVDLALHDFLRNKQIKVELVMFTAEGSYKIPSNDEGLQYQHLQSVSQLESFDRIVYWGDFLHWIGYAKKDFSKRQKQRNLKLSDEQILDGWYKLFMLESSPSLQKKVIVFGSTLYGLNTLQLSDSRYLNALKNLYANARLIQMRDVFSANFINQLAPNRVSTFGCDCALLFKPKKLNPSIPISNSRYIAYSFKRCKANIALSTFMQQLSIYLNISFLDINWLDNSGIDGLSRKIEVIRNADYVMTDIYHLGVTAFRERVPVLSFGRALLGIENSLSDKKKELFFTQAFAAGHYVPFEKVHNALNSDEELNVLIKECAEILNNAESNAITFKLLARQIEVAENLLVDALIL